MANVLITGSTGMVGKGVLLECIDDPQIASITLLNRSPIDISHPKIKEIILEDFTDLASVKGDLGKPDACFHNMGVSVIGLNEEEYSRLTFDITAALADVCYALNPSMCFIYISGTGTDSTEKGKIMWARIKGKAENYILKKGFKKALMFRPGIIIPEKDIQSKVTAYRLTYLILWPFFPLLKKLKGVTTTTQVGKAMINALQFDTNQVYFENRDINELANK